jgi:signal transduction histidine kinase
MFARRMALVSLLVATAICLMMPVTYFFMAWRDFQENATIHGQLLADRIQPMVRESPDFWYYNVAKFMEFADQSKIQPEITAIRVYDQGATLRFEQILSDHAQNVFPFHLPIIYNNEVYGYIELFESASEIIANTVMLFFFFGILGIVTGVFLYRYPVRIVRLAEQGVQNHAEQARQQAASDVARLDRLRLVGQMAASIGHEVRNPLTTVKGYLQLFSRRPEYSAAKTQFHLMIDELDRANSIISEFLSLAHNKIVEKKLCNLNSIIQALEPLIRSDALISGISVHVHLEDIPDTLLDENEIRQLILNITRNGMEAMSAGGCLTFTTAADVQTVILSIADQGKGIAPNLIAKLGTPFFTTKETGTGLGLAVCYSIAHRHKAEIDVATGPDGTKFIIQFPLPQ